ncbi:MAG: outer membrane protein transport protein, partial [Pseudolabrys sp.]
MVFERRGFVLAGGLHGAHDVGNDALLPSGYFTYQFNDKLWLGVAINTPFGLSLSYPNLWAGRD